MANPLNKLQTFLTEVWAELKKSSWPTRKDLLDSTIVVIAAIVVLGLFVSAADVVFIKVIAVLTQAG